MSSRGKVAVLTGAGTGIGRAVAIELASANYRLVLAGRRINSLKATLGQAAFTGAEMRIVRTDVTDPTSVEFLFEETWATFGHLDLLFNNAGVGAPAVPLEELTLAQWRAVVDTNLTGAFLCTQQAIRLMRQQDPQGGRIINNGSISAHLPRPYSGAYTAAKHGLVGLTKSTALDGRRYNIACGQIDIGNALTDLTATMAEGVLQADGSVRVEPTMDVRHVARAVAYMASLPLDANVLFMTVMATAMPFVGRG